MRGRPVGSRNKHHPLDPHADKIKHLYKTGVSIARIRREVDVEIYYYIYKHYIVSRFVKKKLEDVVE